MNNLLVVFGTRPEAIKLCPLILELKKHSKEFRTVVCVSAQHREMLDQILRSFHIVPDYDLNLMKSDQTLSHITASILSKLDSIIQREHIDMVLVQGDTTTTFSASLSAYYNQVAVGHVEAGLRTGNKYSPYPEEINRRLTTVLTDVHFAPTEGNRQNLLQEGIASENIFVTGNTVIDALLFIREQIIAEHKSFQEFSNLDFSRRIVLVTGHRRESFGEGFIDLCTALKALADHNREIQIVYPVHLNPNVRRPVNSILKNTPNIILLEPLDYEPFVALMNRAFLVITDSGGVQEEAPALGKPVLVTRSTTERPEALTTGAVKLVGTNKGRIVNEAQQLLDDAKAYQRMSIIQNPYGDGQACRRITEALISYFAKNDDR